MTSRSSSVSLPHFSFTLPFTCFQFPSTPFQSMADLPRICAATNEPRSRAFLSVEVLMEVEMPQTRRSGTFNKPPCSASNPVGGSYEDDDYRPCLCQLSHVNRACAVRGRKDRREF